MNDINIGEHILKLIASVAAIESKVDTIEKSIKEMGENHAPVEIVEKVEKLNGQVVDMNKRLSSIEKELRDSNVLKQHHKSVFGFIVKHGGKVVQLISYLVLVGISIGAVDIALKVPSKSQDQIIHNLQSQVGQVQKEVKKVE